MGWAENLAGGFKNKTEAIADLRRIAAEMGRSPTSAEYQALPRDKRYCSTRTMTKLFGPWNNALFESGLSITDDSDSFKVFKARAKIEFPDRNSRLRYYGYEGNRHCAYCGETNRAKLDPYILGKTVKTLCEKCGDLIIVGEPQMVSLGDMPVSFLKEAGIDLLMTRNTCH